VSIGVEELIRFAQREQLANSCDHRPLQLSVMGMMAWHNCSVLAKSFIVSQQRNLQPSELAFQYQYFAEL